VIYDFYDPCSGPDPNDAAEKWFSAHVETPVAEVLASMRRGIVPSGAELNTAGYFVAAQAVRGRAFDMHMQDLNAVFAPIVRTSQAYKEVLRDRRDETVTDEDLDMVAQSLATAGQARPVERAASMRNMIRYADGLAPKLASRHWSIAESPTRILITGDAPVVARHAVGRPVDGAELFPDEAEILLPLSPKRLLTILPYMLPGSTVLTSQFAAEVNRLLVRSCAEMMLHHPDMRWPADLSLPQARQSLRIPRVTIDRSDPGSPPTNMDWPTMIDPSSQEALNLLGGDPDLDSPPSPRQGRNLRSARLA
jgi:hypothetical protein